MDTQGLLLQWLEAVQREDGDGTAWLREWLRQQARREGPREGNPGPRERRLRRRLRASLRFVSALAELLGACPRCFGQNPDCAACGGAGAPGFRAPDPALAQWIEPALRRLGYRVVAGRTAPPVVENTLQDEET